MDRLPRSDLAAAVALFASAATALIWASLAPSGYEEVWHSVLSLQAGRVRLALDLREWVNSGLMTLFFFVVGLEARRELDVGDLRERRRLLLPVLTSVTGMAAAAGLYLAMNAGRGSAGGWTTAIPTDTAAALGVVALSRPRQPGRLRAFVLSVSVVNDAACLVVIGTVHSRGLHLAWLALAAVLLAVIVAMHAARLRRGPAYPLLGAATWLAVHQSEVDPVLVGLVMGLLTYAHPVARTDLKRATEAFRGFRQRPSPALARSASAQLFSAISPNERLQDRYHPWTSYLVVPVFVLANAGVPVGLGSLARALTSPPALGIAIASVAGKPAGVIVAAWLTRRLSGGRLRPPVHWGSVAGAGTVSGIGLTASLLIAALAFTGSQLIDVKTGILTASLAATLISVLVFRAPALLPSRTRHRSATADPCTTAITSSIVLPRELTDSPTRDGRRA